MEVKPMGETIFRGDNDWIKWGKKWVAAVGVPILATGILYTAEYINVNPIPVDPKYAFLSGLFVTILYQIGNLIKHA